MRPRKRSRERFPSATIWAAERELRRIASGISGTVGVCAAPLAVDMPLVGLNMDMLFPMASTCKVALAAYTLKRVDNGLIHLNDMLEVPAASLVESAIIADNLIHPGVSLSYWNLLDLMLVYSDNTATDVLISAIGGAAAVTAWLREVGIIAQRVDRDTAEVIRWFLKLPAGPFPKVFGDARRQNGNLDRRLMSPNVRFDRDRRDSSTPRAMTKLLGMLFRGELLSKRSTRLLASIMQRCKTGGARIRKHLSADTVVANKTGTIGGTTNDVGVITLPGLARQIVISIFIKESADSLAMREEVIADSARFICDFFVLTQRQSR